jgi:hypothetical protein
MKHRKTSIFSLFLMIFVLSSHAVAQPSQFNPRGPGGGGAFFASSFNPSDPNEIYVGCDMSDEFHTTDLGASWDVVDFRKMQSWKISPVQYCNNNIRYAIDGANVNGLDVQRPTKSTDGGITWKPLPNDASGGGAYSLFADPNNNQHVIMSDYSIIYTSSDGGNQFFTRYQAKDNGAGIHLAGAFFDGNNIYLGTNDGVLVSTDGGVSFTTATLTGIPSTEYIVSFTGAKQGSTIRFFCVTLGQVYAGITGADKDEYKNVYKMDWGSGHWQTTTSGIDASALPFFAAMSPTNINIAYVAGGSSNSSPTVYKTTDGGGSWLSVFKTTNNQNIFTGWSGQGGDRAWSYGEYALGFSVAPSDPNYACITDLGYAHITSNGGTDWHAAYVPAADLNPEGANTPTGKSYHNVGLENTTCWQISWLDQANMFGCYSDIKGTRSTDAGATWGFNYTGHNDNSMYYVVKVGGRVYGATSTRHDMYQSTTLADNLIDVAKGKVLFSTDNGATWQIEHDFAHPVIWLASDPKDAKTLYASVINSSSGGIYVTHNANAGAASSWSKFIDPPRTEGHPLDIRVLNNGNLLASFSGHRTSNFTASSGVFLSTDGGTSWQDRSDAGMKYWTWDVVVDPYDATENTWYAGVFSGWGGSANGLGGLYKTTNAGVAWTKVKSLPDGVTSCTFSPSDPNVMYFTSQTEGLWYSTNARNAFPAFTQVASYPFRQPMRVFYNPYDSNEVWVSSFGNGMRVGRMVQVTPKPGAVTLQSPANADTTQATNPTLTWQTLNEATSYQVQLSTSQNFSTTVIDSSGVKTTTLPISGLQQGMTYYWRVLASNAGGSGPWSEIWHFTVANVQIPKPQKPILIAPQDSFVFGDVLFPFLWHRSANATVYQITIAKDTQFQTIIITSAKTPDTTFSLSAPLPNGNYYWRVEAFGDGGNSPYSEIRYFGVSIPVGVRNDLKADIYSLFIYPNPFK